MARGLEYKLSQARGILHRVFEWRDANSGTVSGFSASDEAFGPASFSRLDG